MDYLSPVKRAFKLTYKFKFLWILGILATFTEGGGFNFNLGGFNFEDIRNFKQNNTPSGPDQFPVTNIAGKILGEKTASLADNLINFLTNNLTIILIIGIILLALAVIILILSIIAKAGLIWAVASLDEKQKISLKEAFNKGAAYFWPILAIILIFCLMLMAALILYLVPTIIFLVLKLYILGAIYGLVLLIPLILFLIWLVIIQQYAFRICVLENKSALKSIKEGFRFFKDKIKDILIYWLIAIALRIGIGIGLAILYLIILGILVAIGFGIWAIFNWLGVIIYSLIFGLLFLIFSMIISGIITTFISSYWTLNYKDLKK